MNWARDDEGISDADFAKVFKYEPKETTVVRMLSDNDVSCLDRDSLNSRLSGQWQPEICSLETEKQWYHWAEDVSSPERSLGLC
jgi:hypothetical protein